MRRWTKRPKGSNWGDFGADDQLGRLNLITEKRRLRAMQAVVTGKTFCLSLPLDLPGGSSLNKNRRPPQRHIVTRENGEPSVNFAFASIDPSYVDASCDDSVTIFTQYSTQWDGLAHVGQFFDADGDGKDEVVYYNGFRGHEHIVGPDHDQGPGALALGIEKMAETCVQGRGVMLDLQKHFGDERILVGFDELMQVVANDNVRIETGDMVCLHTGFSRMILEMDGKPNAEALANACAVLDGRDEKLLRWIDESGMSVLIADNYAVETTVGHKTKTERCAKLPLHELCLFKLGIHLGELWYLSDLNDWLSEQGRSHFLLTAPPLRLPGSFGSPVTPVATV